MLNKSMHKKPFENKYFKINFIMKLMIQFIFSTFLGIILSVMGFSLNDFMFYVIVISLNTLVAIITYYIYKI